jgi:hypothetical protein
MSLFHEISHKFLEDNNVISLIVQGDFINKTSQDEVAEATLTLLGKIALAYPDAMTKEWLSNDQLQLKLEKLITEEESKTPYSYKNQRVTLACRFISDWISKYKPN